MKPGKKCRNCGLNSTVTTCFIYQKIPPLAQPQSKLYVAEGYTTFSFLVGACAGGEFFLLYKEHSQKIVSHYTSNFSFISVPPHLFNCSNHICCVLFTFIMLSSLFDAYINSVTRLTSVCANHNWEFFRVSFSSRMHAVVQAFLREKTF